MACPIGPGDFAITYLDAQFISYKIFTNHNGLISIVSDEETVVLERNLEKYTYLGVEVFFISKELVSENIELFYKLLGIDDKDMTRYCEEHPECGALIARDAFWASRFYNIFKNIPSIHTIIRAKPAEMQWITFYNSIYVNLENNILSQPVSQTDASYITSIYDAIRSWFAFY